MAGNESLNQSVSSNVMGELFDFFESEATTAAMNSALYEGGSFPGSGYESVIKFDGVPILPPLMTPSRREEMKMYKNQAIIAETRMKARSRQKLLERVQSVLNTIEARKAAIPSQEEDSVSIDRSSTSVTEIKKMRALESKTSEDFFMDACESKPNLSDNHGYSETSTILAQPVITQVDSQKSVPDSGVYTNPPTTLTEENFKAECPLDTMADITDISSEEQNQDLDIDSPRSAKSNESSKDNLSTKVDDTEVQLSADRNSNENNIGVDTKSETEPELENITKLKIGDIDLLKSGESVLDVIDDRLEIENSRNDQMLSHVKDDVQNLYHGLNVAEGGKENTVVTSMKSTSSSTTTLSSEEMNRTVIAKEDMGPHEDFTDDEASYHSASEEDRSREGMNNDSVIEQNKNEKTPQNSPLQLLSTGQSTLLSRVSLTFDADDLNESDIEHNGSDHDTGSLGYHLNRLPSETTEDFTISEGEVKIPFTDTMPMSTFSEGEALLLHANHVQSTLKQNDDSDKENMEHFPIWSDSTQEPSTGPNSTPNLSDISCADEIGIMVEIDDPANVKRLNVMSQTDKNRNSNSKGSMADHDDTSSSSDDDENDTPVFVSAKQSQADLQSTEKSEDLSTVNTMSTELGPYMKTSSYSLKSALTTLPHLESVQDEYLKEMEQLNASDVSRQRTDSDVSEGVFSDQHHSDNEHRKKNKSEALSGLVRRGSYTLSNSSPDPQHSDQHSDNEHSKKSSSDSSSKHVRRGSYTLLHPSPALVNSQKKSETKHELSKSTKKDIYNITSSMEDLKLKPVKKKLSYEDPLQHHKTKQNKGPRTQKVTPSKKVTPPIKVTPPKKIVSKQSSTDKQFRISVAPQKSGTPTVVHKRPMAKSPVQDPIDISVEDGKVEHLHRYLSHLSQMPIGQSMQEHHDVQDTQEFVPSRRFDLLTVQHSPMVPGHAVARDRHGDGDYQNFVGGNERHQDYSFQSSVSAKESDRYIDTSAQRPESSANSQFKDASFHHQTTAERHYREQDASFQSSSDSIPQEQFVSMNEELLRLQVSHFENMRQQLIAQQQQQLEVLLAEQERQQKLFQDEIAASLQGSANLSGSSISQLAHEHTAASLAPSEAEHFVRQDHGSYPVPPMGPDMYYLNDFRPYSAPIQVGHKVSFALPNTSHNAHPVDSRDMQSVRTHSEHSTSHADVLHISHTEPDSMQPNSGNLDFSHLLSSVNNGGCLSPKRHRPQIDRASPHRETAPSTQPTHFIQSPYQASEDSLQDVGISVEEHIQELAPTLHQKFEKISAAAKGYLTRRLLRSEKVQEIIKTIRDTAEFALAFLSESPIKKGIHSMQDKNLQDRVLAQLTAAMYEIHDIFFEISTKERMAIISQSRQLYKEKMFKQQPVQNPSPSEAQRRISAATAKAINRRRKAKAAEEAMFAQMRPKSAPPNTSSPKRRDTDLSGPIRRNYQFFMNRALRPIQAQLSPIKPEKDSMNRAMVKDPKIAVPRKKTVVAQQKPRPKTSAPGSKVIRKTAGPSANKGVTNMARKIARPSDHGKQAKTSDKHS